MQHNKCTQHGHQIKTSKVKGRRNESSRAELHQVLYADDDSLIQQANLNATCSRRWELGVPRKTRSRQTADRIMRGNNQSGIFAPPGCFWCSRASRKVFFLQTTKMLTERENSLYFLLWLPSTAETHTNRQPASQTTDRQINRQTDVCAALLNMNLQRSREQLRKKKVQKISLQAGAQVKLNDKLYQLGSNQIISWVKKKKKKEKKK